jgi:hypothetical protein
MEGIMYWRFFGLALVMFCAGVWAWMLGAFSNQSAGMSQYVIQWSAPGLLSFPATVSTIAGIVGLLFLTGVFPINTKLEQAQNLPAGIGE